MVLEGDDPQRAGRPCQAVTADRLTAGVLLTVLMVSRVMLVGLLEEDGTDETDEPRRPAGCAT